MIQINTTIHVKSGNNTKKEYFRLFASVHHERRGRRRGFTQHILLYTLALGPVARSSPLCSAIVSIGACISTGALGSGELGRNALPVVAHRHHCVVCVGAGAAQGVQQLAGGEKEVAVVGCEAVRQSMRLLNGTYVNKIFVGKNMNAIENDIQGMNVGRKRCHRKPQHTSYSTCTHLDCDFHHGGLVQGNVLQSRAQQQVRQRLKETPTPPGKNKC